MRRWLCRKKEEGEGGTWVVDSGVSRCVCPLDVHKGRKRSDDSDTNVRVSNVTVQGIRAVPWWKRQVPVTRGSCDGKGRWSTHMDDETDEALSDMDDLYSPDLGDDWKNWRVDDPELESGETAEVIRGTEEEAEELEKGEGDVNMEAKGWVEAGVEADALAG